MKTRSKLEALTGLLPILVILWVWVDGSVQPSSSQPRSASSGASGPVRIAERAVAEVHKKGDWADVRVDDGLTNERHYALILNYARRPASIGEVEADTRAVAHAVLDSLMRAGQDPFTAKVDVAVWARRPIDSEADRQMFEVYGVTNYDAATDELKFAAELR